MVIRLQRFAGFSKTQMIFGMAEKILFYLLLLFSVIFNRTANASAADECFSVTASYSGAVDFDTITVDFCDEWFHQPDDQYNHKLMQATFAMAVTAFRSQVYDEAKDHDILDFFDKTGFIEPRSNDFNRETGINTIGSVIAHKKIGDETVIAVAISGNNYQNEWLSNFTIENKERPAGFNSAAEKVKARLENYIRTHQLTGNLRLWITGYSRSAAIANIVSAEAVDSRRYQAVYAYTFATPRTTRELNPERYSNIFNLINPEDVVPMVPFAEWGFARYGVDLFLPSISTDSSYMAKYQKALSNGKFGDEVEPPIFNPRVRRELHTVFDYLAFFIDNAQLYADHLQKPLIDFYQNKDVGAFLREILSRISFKELLESIPKNRTMFLFYLNEIYNFLDYNLQTFFLTYIAHNYDYEYKYWDKNLTLLENVAFSHLEKTYRAWLFSSDDPAEIFKHNPDYFHYTILGDVDLEIYDENGALIANIDSGNDENYDLTSLHWPGFKGEISKTKLYMERGGNRRLIVVPADQVYTVHIYSNKDQNIRVTCVKYDVEKLRGEVKYFFYADYDKGEEYTETIDPAMERMDPEDIPEDFAGVELFEPWEGMVVYSPTVIMQLENSERILQRHLPVMILLHVITNLILALLILLIIKAVRGIVVVTVKKVFGKEFPNDPDPLESPRAKKNSESA
ncbi:MAG: hypothetical protein IJI41_02025 [Anaerolineaceae bacterium]|nr:hypothetical protein [Anaerolineaceae bacterium]